MVNHFRSTESTHVCTTFSVRQRASGGVSFSLDGKHSCSHNIFGATKGEWRCIIFPRRKALMLAQHFQCDKGRGGVAAISFSLDEQLREGWSQYSCVELYEAVITFDAGQGPSLGVPICSEYVAL